MKTSSNLKRERDDRSKDELPRKKRLSHILSPRAPHCEAFLNSTLRYALNEAEIQEDLIQINKVLTLTLQFVINSMFRLLPLKQMVALGRLKRMECVEYSMGL